MMKEIRSIGIVGAGTMGTGIAQLALESGYSVFLQDVHDNILNRAHARLSRALEKEGRSTLLARVHFRKELAELNSSDCAVEAAPEDLALKRRLFKELDRIFAPECLLATNTSSLRVGDVAQAARHPERVVGLHFFNPPPVMKLVELVGPEASSREALELAARLAAAMGKTVVRAADTPGFIANRVARPFYLVALRLLAAGEATPATLDAAVRAGGFKMGPCQLMDLIGLDVNLAITHAVYQGLGRPKDLEPVPVQEALVKRGMLGRKSGAGFYLYEDQEGPVENPVLRELVAAPGARAASSEEILRRVLAGVIAEANRAYAEGVASREAIDSVMKLGLSWPKGPFVWEKELKSAP